MAFVCPAALVNVPAGHPVALVAKFSAAGAGKASWAILTDREFLHTTGTEPPLVTPSLLTKLLSRPLVT